MKNRTNRSRKHVRTKRRGPRYWIITVTAMGALVAYTVGNSRRVVLAHASEFKGLRSSGLLNSQDTSRQNIRFDIKPGPLSAAIPVFEQISRLKVVVPNPAILELLSPGVSGLYSPEQALKQLLAGTSVACHFSDSNTVLLELQLSTESVDVQGENAAQVTSTKYTEPLLDTPQTVTVISRKVIEEQGATTLRDTLRNVAGISLAAGEGGAQGDNLTIRGFTARNDIFIDAMRDFGSYYRDPFNIEEVEVLEGPSAVTFGRGTTGGVVNQESKSPQLTQFIRGSATFGSDKTRRITTDINKPITAFGTGAAFRLNLMGNDSNVAGRDIAENRRFGIAPSLAIGLGQTTRLMLSYFHQTGDDIPDYGIPWLFNGPAPVRRNNYYGFRDGNFLKTNADIGTVKFDHDFNATFSLHNQSRYARYSRDVQITEAKVAGKVTPATPLTAINVDRGQIAARSTETFLQNQSDLTARFKMGAVNHTLVSGIEIGRETSAPSRFAFTGVPTTSLLSPDTTQPFAGTSTISSRVRAAANSIAVYVLDTLKIGRKLELSGGVRWERFDASYNQSAAPVSAFQRVDAMTSWRGAIVYKPKANGSVYFSSGTSFNPSAEALALSAGTANIGPEKNRTLEIGSKWDFYRNRLSLRTSLFKTEKLNAREIDPTNALLVVLSGTQQVKGFEAQVTGQVSERLQVLASYALLDSRLVSSRLFPAAVGSRLANVPRNTFNLWTNYRVPGTRLTLGGGSQFVDSRTASSTVPLDPTTHLVRQVPSYWVFNAVAKYPLGEKLDLQVNAYNLADRYYYDQIHPAHIVPGPGRSVLAGLNFKF